MTTFSSEQVWAAAVAAQRINKTYINRKVSNTKPTSYEKKLTNFALMRILLKTNCVDVTSNDFDMGQTIRTYYCSLMSKLFDDTALAFIRAAVHVASLTEFDINSNDILMVASLPNAYFKTFANNNQERQERLQSLIANSTPLIEYYLNTTIEIITCKYRAKFAEPYMINALVEGTNQVVYFTDARSWELDKKYKIVGYSTGSTNNKTTRLYKVILVLGNINYE